MTNVLAPIPPTSPLPALTAAGERAGVRFLEFFADQLRNAHMRRAYNRAVGEFLAQCRRRLKD